MKRLICLLACISILTVLWTGALANSLPRLEAKMLDVLDDGTIRVAYYSSITDEQKKEDVTITINDQVVQSHAVNSYKEEKIGTSWLFVVDQAPKSTHIDAMKELINAVIMDMGPQDNAAILEANTLISEVVLSDDKNKLLADAEKLEATKGETINNTQIATSLIIGDKLEAVKPRINILVISSGQTVNDVGKTQGELKQLASESNATVYTVAFVPYKGDKKKAEAFGEIARASSDGLAQILEYNHYDSNAVMLEIIAHESRFHVAHFAPESADWNELILAIKSDDHVLTDKIGLTDEQVERLQQNTVQPTPEPTSTPAPTSEPTAGVVIKEFVSDNMLIVVAGGVLVVLVIVLIAMKVGKKKESIEISDQNSESENNSGTEIIEEHESGVQVRLEQIDAPTSQVFTAYMRDELIIGREPQYSKIAISDKKISARHVKLSYRSGGMYIEDLNSRNGTKVNGMQISSMVSLQQNDIIMIGLTKLRIVWTVKAG